MAARSGKRRTRGGEDLRNTKTLSPARDTCRACRLSMQRGSGCGADRMVACSRRWDWRATRIFLRRASTCTACMIGLYSCPTGKSVRALPIKKKPKNLPFGRCLKAALVTGNFRFCLFMAVDDGTWHSGKKAILHKGLVRRRFISEREFSPVKFIIF